MNLQKKYELKIENGIGGGSLSLWSDGVQKHYIVGDQDAKKSDYLIENMSAVLLKNNAKKSEIKKITFSNYPVSQMGLKILSSIIKGFETIYTIDVDRKNLFDSISDYFSKTVNEKKMIVLPSSANKLEFALFNKIGEKESGGILNAEIFGDTNFKIGESETLYIYAAEENIRQIESEIKTSTINPNLVFVGLEKNLSKYL